jgi:SAM-dependent methyltransferase
MPSFPRAAMSPRQSRFDHRYFDRWYRDPRHRVKTGAELDRQVAVAVSAAEWVLDRPIRSVLDVGAGEGNWRKPLRALRPRVRYLGLDPSPYVVSRFGRSRNIRAGSFGDLSSISPDDRFDLVVCCGVAQFVIDDEFVAGLPRLVALAAGVLHLELFTRADGIVGDRSGHWRSAAWYRRQLQGAGLRSCGLHNYVPSTIARAALAELEMSI